MEKFSELDEASIQAARRNELAEGLSMLRTADASDVCLVCQGKEFYAHRVVLSSSSPYFATMFRTQMKERESGRVAFDNIEARTLEVILDFIYLGKVKDIKTEEDYIQAVAASHLMRLEQLFLYCCTYLGNKLSLSNFFTIFHIGELCESDVLKGKTQEFWLSNSDKLLATKGFIWLSVDEMKLLVNYLRHKGLCLDDVLSGVIQWLRYDLKKRDKLATSLLKCMEGKLLSKSFVQSLLQDQELMKSSYRISSEIKELGLLTFISGTDGLLTKTMTPSTLDIWTTKVTYFGLHYRVEVFDPNSNSVELPAVAELSLSRMCVQQLDLKTMKWLLPHYPLSDLCTDRLTFQYKNFLYILDSLKNDNSVQFDLQHDSFLSLGIRGEPFFSPNSLTCYFKGILYAFGGNNTAVYYLKPSDLNPIKFNPWYVAPALLLPQNKSFIALASSRYIYIVGNESYSQDELSVQYSSDPKSEYNQWEITVLKSGLHPSQFFVLNDTLNALYFGKSQGKHLVFNHDSKTFKIKRLFRWPEGESTSLHLSRFQNPGCPLVFFSKKDDYFGIPYYQWEPETSIWTKMPPLKNKSVIHNCDKGLKMFYYLESK